MTPADGLSDDQIQDIGLNVSVSPYSLATMGPTRHQTTDSPPGERPGHCPVTIFDAPEADALLGTWCTPPMGCAVPEAWA
jgi:hypothetical protein